MYRIVMIYDGEEDEQDEVFETEEAAEEYGTPGNMVNGANIAGFNKVATAMLAHGLV